MTICKGPVPLKASSVDGLSRAGLVDPAHALDPDARSIVSNPSLLFPGVVAGATNVPSIDHRNATKYIKLVATQLRSGKIGLTYRPAAGGVSFAVGKRGSDKVREVWHGAAVSDLCMPPPTPPHLLPPTAVVYLQCDVDSPYSMSKRDAACCFDQLRLHGPLQRWMCKPMLRTSQLEQIGGMPTCEQASYVQVGEVFSHGAAWPASLVWPMGFAWSSSVARRQFLHTCSKA